MRVAPPAFPPLQPPGATINASHNLVVENTILRAAHAWRRQWPAARYRTGALKRCSMRVRTYSTTHRCSMAVCNSSLTPCGVISAQSALLFTRSWCQGPPNRLGNPQLNLWMEILGSWTTDLTRSHATSLKWIKVQWSTFKSIWEQSLGSSRVGIVETNWPKNLLM